MANVTEICNKALTLLGAKLISSIDDESNEARFCKAQFDVLRDDMLEQGEWSFAIMRDTLPPSADPPVNLWATLYAVPPDLIRLLECSYDPDLMTPVQWAVEGNRIAVRREAQSRLDYFASADPTGGNLQVKYIYRELNTERYTSLFTEAFSARLAAEGAIPLAQSAKLEALMRQRYEGKMANALATDAIGAGRSKRLRATRLIKVR